MAKSIVDKIFHFFHKVNDESHLNLKYHKAGLLTKSIEIEFLERKKARKAAAHAVFEKNDIIREYIKLLRNIKNHEINQTREDSKKIVELLINGLQETYDAMFEEMLVLKANLKEAVLISEKVGTNADLRLIRSYESYIENTIKFLNEEYRAWIDEIIAAIEGKEIATGALNIEVSKYKVKGLFSPLRPVFEWFAERQLENKTFKLEHRLEKLEHSKTLGDKETLHKLVMYEKEINYAFRHVLKDMAIFTLLLVRTAEKTANEIAEAASEKRFDLPKAMEVYSTGLFNILNEEREVLKSLNTSSKQLIEMAQDAKKSIGKLITKIEKLQKETKTAKVAA